MPRRRLRAFVPLLAVLAATVLAAAPASAGGGCHAPATEGRVGTTVALVDLCFTPTVLRVAPGSTVTFVNRDTMTHPLSRPGGEWGWDGMVGDRTSVRLEEPGTYPFFCYVHPGMVGVVVVGDGRGTGAALVQVDDPAAPTAAGGQPATAEAAATGSAPSSGDLPSFPAAWLVLTALAALAGAAAGTRLAGNRSSSG
jgi:plastocyanin